MIQTTHNAGFFSCCSIKLCNIVSFINKNGRLPDAVDSSKQFVQYKRKVDECKDITFHYFQNYNTVNTNIDIKHPIKYCGRSDHHARYSKIDFEGLKPLIRIYFSPSDLVSKVIEDIVNKYNIKYDNTLAVYFRGTDKHKEINLPKAEDYCKRITEIVNINPNIYILVQSDCAKFVKYIQDKKLNVVFIDENKTSSSNKGIHNENSSDQNYYDMFNFLATIIIMSKCKYIICNSSNCSLWIALYRGHIKNVIQHPPTGIK